MSQNHESEGTPTKFIGNINPQEKIHIFPFDQNPLVETKRASNKIQDLLENNSIPRREFLKWGLLGLLTIGSWRIYEDHISSDTIAKKAAQQEQADRELEKNFTLGNEYSIESSQRWRIRHPAKEPNLIYREKKSKPMYGEPGNEIKLPMPNIRDRGGIYYSNEGTTIFLHTHQLENGAFVPKLEVKHDMGFGRGDLIQNWILRARSDEKINTDIVEFSNPNNINTYYLSINIIENVNKTSFELKYMEPVQKDQ